MKFEFFRIFTAYIFGVVISTVPAFTLVKKQRRTVMDDFDFQEPYYLPNCAKTAVITGEIVRQNLDTTEIAITTNIHVNLGFQETACFHVQLNENLPVAFFNQSNVSTTTSYDQGQLLSYNGSLLYTIEYQGLRQIHPVRQQYTFAIPQLHSNCVCDCPGGENHCPIGYNYKNCTKANSVCVTTYHPHQSTAGCLVGEEASLCCQVFVEPHKNVKYQAVYLGQPDTVAEFHYRLYRSGKSGRWMLIDEHRIKVPLNKQHRLDIQDDKLEIQVNGLKPHFQLKEDMYFFETDLKEAPLRTGVPLNEMYEWNIGKLGWFRYDEISNQWTVRNGWIKLQDAHHAQVENCKEQKYTENFNAEYFTTTKINSDSDNTVYLGRTVEDVEKWVLQAAVTTNDSNYRQIIVTHADSPAISLDLTMNNRLNLKMVHHSSDMKDFSGEIQLDKFSNKFLNLTYYEAKGTLIGIVYADEAKKRSEMAFSSFVNSLKPVNNTAIILLPSTVNGSRYVCMHPVERQKMETCHWLKFQAQPLDWFKVPYGWTNNQGDCKDCNEMTFTNFLQYLNPAKWFNGITNPAEALAVGLEVIVYFIVIVVVIAVCRRCVCPLLRWSVCKGGVKIRTKPKIKNETTE